MKIVLATGGTAGHLFPALKTAKELRARGHEVVFIGDFRGRDERIKQEGFECYSLNLLGLSSKKIVHVLSAGVRTFSGIMKSKNIFSKIRPHAVVGFGSYSSFSPVFAACLFRIPIILHEQNVAPGKANRWLSHVAKAVGVSFEETMKSFPKGKTFLTGCPVLIEKSLRTKEEILLSFDLKVGRKTIFVFGGSQGSHRINHVFMESIEDLVNEGFQFIHVTGASDFVWVKNKYEQLNCPYAVFDFLGRMSDAYSVADVVVARSGAATINEIVQTRCKSVLIPYPFAGSHQKDNAKLLAETGLCSVIEEENLSSRLLLEAIKRICVNEQKILEQVIKQHFFVDAHQRLSDLIEKTTQ